jgi:hypothetical protein
MAPIGMDYRCDAAGAATGFAVERHVAGWVSGQQRPVRTEHRSRGEAAVRASVHLGQQFHAIDPDLQDWLRLRVPLGVGAAQSFGQVLRRHGLGFAMLRATEPPVINSCPTHLGSG